MGFGLALRRQAISAEIALDGPDEAAAQAALQDSQGAGSHIAQGAGSLRSHLPRLGVTLALAALFLGLLWFRLADVDVAAVAQAAARAPLSAWAGAFALTCAAFWAVGQYDAVLHRHFDTGVPAQSAQLAGISAIAVSQTLGMGLVTGSVLRWRMMPDRSFWLASRITLAVALSFLAGWAVVTAAVVAGVGPATSQAGAKAALALAACAAALALIAPSAPFRWPNMFTIASLLSLTALDTLAAAGALYLLLPADAALPVHVFLPAFLLAYGAGLLSGAPGGIGAFELTLLALLPAQGAEGILGAVLAWRIVYFVFPAVIGAVAAMIGPRRQVGARVFQRHASATEWKWAQDLGAIDGPSETGLIAQGGHEIVAQGALGWLVGARGHILVGLFDPLVARPWALQRGAALDLLSRAARQSGRWPALYKVSARMAGAARGAGWRVVRCAREAVLLPAAFDLATPARAGLRRKLRRAEAAGLSVTLCDAAAVPRAEMAAVAAQWAARHGGERGFSMGRFEAGYLARQRVYLAQMGGQVVGFASFHTAPIANGSGRDIGSGREWVLDVMRHGPALPDGGMHALVHAALVDAAALGVARLSLAAVPEAAFGPQGGRGRAAARRASAPFAKLLRLDRGDGLRRFKDAFAPAWEPRYLCARHGPALALAALSIARAIAFAPALPLAGENSAPMPPKPHYRFALPARFWHGKA